jgi:signal transduction histidine kinase
MTSSKNQMLRASGGPVAAPALRFKTDFANELLITLGSAQTLKSTADAVGNYCSRAFGSPAGMIFVDRDGDLQLVSQWRSKPASKKSSTAEVIKTGPVARVFQTGEALFWNSTRKLQSNVSHFLFGLLPRSQYGSASFLPISVPGQRPAGVIAIIFPAHQEFTQSLRDDLLQLSQIISGYIQRARTHDEAVAAQQRAEHAVQKQDEFLAALAHELRNPMTPILGWAVALSSGTLPAERTNLALEGIVRNIRTLDYLIEDMFDAVRISSGKLRLQPSEIRIQEVAREALTVIQHLAEDKKLRIATEISEAVPPFIADPRRLRQVLMNLLNNAVKFTPPGGCVSLKVLKRDHSVECVVSDTGKGIDPKFLPFVFDRFRQENRYAKARGTGLGLGLAIVREIVSLHGGSITVQSKGADKGATFVLRLPIRKGPLQGR